MKKFELVREVAKQSGHSQEVVNSVIDAMCAVVAETVVTNGEEVNLPALGKFKQKVNAARKGINPLNKKPIDIPETHTLAFKPTSSLKVTVE
jgi:nucleoid DNA-binding protein